MYRNDNANIMIDSIVPFAPTHTPADELLVYLHPSPWSLVNILHEELNKYVDRNLSIVNDE